MKYTLRKIENIIKVYLQIIFGRLFFCLELLDGSSRARAAGTQIEGDVADPQTVLRLLGVIEIACILHACWLRPTNSVKICPGGA